VVDACGGPKRVLNVIVRTQKKSHAQISEPTASCLIFSTVAWIPNAGLIPGQAQDKNVSPMHQAGSKSSADYYNL